MARVAGAEICLRVRSLPQPFIDEGHAVLAIFPAPQYAYLPFCLLGILIISGMLGFVGLLFIQEGMKQRA